MVAKLKYKILEKKLMSFKESKRKNVINIAINIEK